MSARYTARRTPWVRSSSKRAGTFMFWGVWDTVSGVWHLAKVGDMAAAKVAADAANRAA